MQGSQIIINWGIYILVPKLDMELMIVNVDWIPAYDNTSSSEYKELTDNITKAVSTFDFASDNELICMLYNTIANRLEYIVLIKFCKK